MGSLRSRRVRLKSAIDRPVTSISRAFNRVQSKSGQESKQGTERAGSLRMSVKPTQVNQSLVRDRIFMAEDKDVSICFVD